jgi:hypothetical protein
MRGTIHSRKLDYLRFRLTSQANGLGFETATGNALIAGQSIG